jgi:23S rRNA (uracil1939-C5)-methyltransferase
VNPDVSLIEGKAERLLPGGEAVVRKGKTSVLVANAVAGDLLKVQIQSRRRGAERGKIIEIIQPSPQRISSPCPVASSCGGCALQYMGVEDQAELKSDWVSHAFKSLKQPDTEWIPVIASDHRFRRRVRWVVGHDKQGTFLGYFAPASHQPVRHSNCMVVTAELNELHILLENQLSLKYLDSVQAVQLSDGIHIILEGQSCPDIASENLKLSLPLQWWWRNEGITRPLHKPVKQLHDVLPAGEQHIHMIVGPDDFVQGQIEGNREMISQIQQWCGSVQRISDLFCGIGNLSLPLAKATGATVFGAELNSASVSAASANAKRLGVNAQFSQANLFEDFDMEPFIGADVLILDPPRRGAKRICSNIMRLLPARIIMVSCDPAAGARDGALLKQHGYKLAALRALDLFPIAGHVEVMSYWIKS